MKVSGRSVLSRTVSAVVTRADGTVEDLGIISSYRAPWWRRLGAWLRRAIS